jgi:predicted signal transduction protein with EAL and GGDEF domain
MVIHIMARTIETVFSAASGVRRRHFWPRVEDTERAVYFRALMDLGTGGVAAIEAAWARPVTADCSPERVPGFLGRQRVPANLCAWGHEVRTPAAYLVRAQCDTRPDAVAAAMGVATEKVILMYDVTSLLAQPTAALESLLAGKRSGARILLDHIDMADPPARFLEMLPADILRVSPDRMPWHWEENRRLATLESLLAFAGNLLMDVAVEGVDNEGQRRTFKQLGVRYVQGGWRRDHLGLVPDPTPV